MELNNQIEELKETVKKIKSKVKEMKNIFRKTSGEVENTRPIGVSESYLEKEEDHWRKRIEQRLTAQEDSVRHLHNRVGSLEVTVNKLGTELSDVVSRLKKPSSPPIFQDDHFCGSGSTSFTRRNLSNSAAASTMSSPLKKPAEDLDDFLGKITTGGSVANDEFTLDNISRDFTVSSLPDEVVGTVGNTSFPSESTVLEMQEEVIKINLNRSMSDKKGTDGEQDIMKPAYKEIDDSTDEHVSDGASSALINRVDAVPQKLEKDIDAKVLDRGYDGIVTSEELASATAYLKDAMAKEGIIELISKPSKDNGGNCVLHHDDEHHITPVFEQAAESSSSGVLHNDEDEDHFPPEFEQDVVSRLKKPSSPPIFQDDHFCGSGSTSFTRRNLSNSAAASTMSSLLKKPAEDLDDFLGKITTGGSVPNDQLTLDNISRDFTVSPLLDEVVGTVGITSFPSESTAQTKLEFLEMQEEVIKINLNRSMSDKKGTDGEQDMMKPAYKEIDDSIDEHVPDWGSSALINRVDDAVTQKLEKDIDAKVLDRGYDGIITSEELASATAYLKDDMAKDGIIELISKPSKDNGGNCALHHDDEHHITPVFEQAAESSSSGVLHNDEDEDHFPPEFEQDVVSRLKKPSSPPIFQDDHFCGSGSTSFTRRNLSNSAAASTMSSLLKKPAEDLDDFLGKITTGGSVPNDQLTLDNISRDFTVSPLLDEVVGTVGITSFPSESTAQTKLEFLEMQEEVIKINLNRSMSDKKGTDGEQDMMKPAYKEIDDSIDEHVPDWGSSALINRVDDAVTQKLEKDIDAKVLDRGYDGIITSEELASATAYLKDDMAKDGIIELISKPSKDNGGNCALHHDDEHHITPVFEQAAESSSSGVLHNDEDEDHFPPEFEQDVVSRLKKPSSPPIFQDDHFCGSGSTSFTRRNLSNSAAASTMSSLLKKPAEDLDDFLGKITTGGSVPNDQLTLDNISRDFTVSPLLDEVVGTVGITSFPSESTAQTKLEFLEMQEEVIKINLNRSMSDKKGTDGEQDMMKPAYKEIDDSIDEHVPDWGSSALINRVDDAVTQKLEKDIDAKVLDRGYDGIITSEELASATAYLKDDMAKDGIIELISKPSKDNGGNCALHHDDEHHITPVFEQAAESSSSGVLHNDEDEDHFPPEFEQAAESSSCVLDDEDDQHEDEDEDDQDEDEEEYEDEDDQEEEDQDQHEEEEEEEEEHSHPALQEKRQMSRGVRKTRDKEKKKAKDLVRCKAKVFVDTMNGLRERWNMLEDSPFYNLLGMNLGVQNSNLIRILVSMFNTKDKSLQVDGCECVVTPEDFTEIMGVEDGGVDVIIPRKPKTGPSTELARLFITVGGQQATVSARKVKKRLTHSKDADIVKQAYALFALGNIICPPARGGLAPSYLKYVRDVSTLKKKQWAAHAIYKLVDFIDKYKKSKGSTRRYIGGCTLFLQLYVMKKMCVTIPKGKLPVSMMSMIRVRLTIRDKERNDSSNTTTMGLSSEILDATAGDTGEENLLDHRNEMILNKILLEAQTPNEVLEVISDTILAVEKGLSPSPLCPLNLETAICRIAKLMDETKMTRFNSSQFARRNKMRALVSMAMEALDEFSAQSISNVAWALPKFGGRYGLEMVKLDAELKSKIGNFGVG